MNNITFDWVPFYKELADKLLPYQKNRQELIEKVRQIYAITGIGIVFHFVKKSLIHISHIRFRHTTFLPINLVSIFGIVKQKNVHRSSH